VRRFLILITCIVQFGCTNVGNPPLVAECESGPEGGRSGPALVGVKYGWQSTPLPLDSVQYSNVGLTKSIVVQGLYASVTATGTVQVNARFVSCVDEPVAISVRTAFLLDNTAPAEPTSAWERIIIQPRLTAVYDESSMSVDAANFMIEVTNTQ
jgi:hypothetical protein